MSTPTHLEIAEANLELIKASPPEFIDESSDLIIASASIGSLAALIDIARSLRKLVNGRKN